MGPVTIGASEMKVLPVRIAALLCAAALLLLGACSEESPSPSSGGASGDSVPDNDTSPAKEESESPAPPPVDAEESSRVTFELWYTKGSSNRLTFTTVTQESTPKVGTAALEALIAGPPAGSGKLTTAIPADVTLNGLTIDGGTATVDLSSSFEEGGGTASMGMRLGQVTFTLTQFPTVQRVAFELDGKLVKVFSNEGLVISKPLTRADFEDIAPPVTVDRPRSGDDVTSPVTISGTANVFEANVSIRIEDADGNVLTESFATADCGTGCRGDYSRKVSFEVDEPTEATIVLFEQSAEDGSDLFPVGIPVTLLP
ncbi:MAG: GerMN domain-containing protein [Actinomycetota bacterium]|nr:GerMN domain-containing protein [Actinomycetota bacterium]